MANCVSCKDYEIQLKEALSELSLTQLIIKLLRNELLISTTSTRADSKDLVFTSNTRVRVGNNKEWTLVSSKKRTEKSNKRSKGETIPTGHLITTTNHFTSLHNFEDNEADPREGQECSEWTSSTKNIRKIRKQHNPGVRIPTIINRRTINSENRNPVGQVAQSV
jgi:hypothetical protein